MPLTDYACEGTLTIDSISMNRPAWSVSGDESGEGGLLNLWATVTRRGENRVLPGAAGVIAYPHYRTETRHDLRLVVVGDVNESGTAQSDARAGLANNIEYLYDNVIDNDVAVAATLTVFGQAARSGTVQVLGLIAQRWNLGIDSAIFVGTLQLLIPLRFEAN